MAERTASAHWEGTIREGSGRVALGSGAFEGAYSFTTRFEDEPGTNPEELIGAAHAGCFTMALSSALSRAGFTPTSIDTTATVHLKQADGGFSIPKIDLVTTAVVPGVEDDQFQELAAGAKTGCPVSKALAAVDITLDATLSR